MTLRLQTFFTSLFVLAVLLSAGPAFAQSRNASFLDPNSAGGGPSPSGGGKGAAQSLVADPAQTDAGETLVNVARRVTVFFFNGFRTPTTLTQLMVNADGNVRSKVLTDDCKSIKTLPAGDRCSIVLEIVPSSPGPWSVELLLNHSGQGRITRAEVTGTTLGKTDEKAEGLAVSKKIAAPLDFGTIKVGEETAARTMLIENDSPEPLHIASIDLISSSQGLRLREAGCKEGAELKSGESCPITVIWEPKARGSIATDLIVRHSGNLGFVVIPIRGKGEAEEKDADGSSTDKPPGGAGRIALLPVPGGEKVSNAPSLPTVPPPSSALENIPPPPSISEIAKKLPASQLANNRNAPTSAVQALPEVGLMGIVNGRAILADSKGGTHVVGLGETTSIDGEIVEVVQVDSTRAVVKIGGVRKELALTQTPSIVRSFGNSMSGGIGAGSSSSGSGSSPAPYKSPEPSLPAVAPAPTSSNDAVAPSTSSHDLIGIGEMSNPKTGTTTGTVSHGTYGGGGYAGGG
jgi:hypothetical protein